MRISKSNSAFVVAFFLMILKTVWAEEPRIGSVRIPEVWVEQPQKDNWERKGWTVRVFKNSDTSDVLTIAKSDQPHPRSFDDVVEFAPSGFPYWFEEENKGFTINRVKTERENEFAFAGKRLSSIAYCVVNEREQDDVTMMGQGYLLLTTVNAFYVQHTSRRPITHLDCSPYSDFIARNCAIARRKMKTMRSFLSCAVYQPCASSQNERGLI